ncbi:hypothetical protein EG328_004520 [Venturia inaequalis]|uniref:Hemerythrin-like domain-containing protein n=1 Tax=Venturia inaequalis TaxID=5025 RepID=A0A8H3ULX8_VENIN|nr:hypothetical protein EG327_009699 [Venturia inaequalis]KAE9973178.1 hypothetical protein EG328_004520 [Venturia inaequalis]
MASFNPTSWADGPFPLIPTPFGGRDVSKEHGSHYLAQQMSLLHNCILRVLNAIYNQAPHVKSKKDIKAFLRLIRLWHDELEHHHRIEEQFFFPKIEEITGVVNFMSQSIDQHQSFSPGVAALLNYSIMTSVTTYHATDLQRIIDSFGETLQSHLHDEIDALLSLEKYRSIAVRKAWEQTHRYVLKTCDNNVQLPMLLGSMDRTYGLTPSSNGVAPTLDMSWYLYYLVEYWFSRKYRASWKFLPCNTWGVPRDLPAMARREGGEREGSLKGSLRRFMVPARKKDSLFSEV